MRKVSYKVNPWDITTQRRQGMSYRRIAQNYKDNGVQVSYSTVRRMYLKWRPRPTPETDRLRKPLVGAVLLDAFRAAERYRKSSLYSLPNGWVFDAQGDEVSRRIAERIDNAREA